MAGGLCPGVGRLHDDEFDVVAFDAAAAGLVVALVIAFVALGWKSRPEPEPERQRVAFPVAADTERRSVRLEQPVAGAAGCQWRPIDEWFRPAVG